MNSKPTNSSAPLLEWLAWLTIVASPTLIGAVLGGLLYLYSPTTLGMIGACGIVLGLFGLGVLWANRVKKKYGAVWFLSRNMATPELDFPVEENESSDQGDSPAASSRTEK